ncbi:MAG: DEAD/DEAH box helicase [Deltaproteobacteria bacterium]|nr:DEAD/DEAH box helicase [Deltaproteobacteria bacterium]
MQLTALSPTPASACVPRIRLFTERVLIDRGTAWAPDYEEAEAPAIQLSFDYGGTVVSAAQPVSRVFVGGSGAAAPLERDVALENHARAVLEAFGAVELSCLEHVAAPGSKADYLVHVESDVHTVCGFTAYTVPQLRRLGWQVEVADSYRWRVVDDAVPFYARLEEDEEPDWFSLELGIDVNGRRINLVPGLLSLLEDAASLKALQKARRRCYALPVGEGVYLPIEPDRLKVLLDVLLELYEGAKGGELKLPTLGAGALARLDLALLGERRVSWEGETRLRDRGYGYIPEAVHKVEAPSGLRATLRPYQEDGLAWMQHLRAQEVGGVLADDMGLGKTLQTIAHLLVEHRSGRAEHPSLVVAPTSLVSNWRRELARFAPALRVLVLHGPKRHVRRRLAYQHDVVLTTYPLLVLDLDELAAQRYHLLVLDEAQAIKNASSQAHRAAKRLDAEHRLCLSGTPLENHLGELWALFDFLTPGLLGSSRQFREHFRYPIEAAGDEHRLEALRQRVAPFVLRRTKDQVARELPPKTEIVRAVELKGAQRDLYESIRVAAHAQVRQAITRQGLAQSTIAILDALMKLRQVCCDPRLVNVRAAREVEETAKYELLFELLPQLLEQGRRVLLFSQFTSMLALIGQGLEQLGRPYVALTGATVDRQRAVDAFEQGQVDVFLISLKAGGTGLNLTSADTVIHYDPWWNPAAQAQATDRAHRIGQTKPVFVYSLIVAGSVEERMLRLQRRKARLAESLLAPQGTAWSADEVQSLFAPLGDSGLVGLAES